VGNFSRIQLDAPVNSPFQLRPIHIAVDAGGAGPTITAGLTGPLSVAIQTLPLVLDGRRSFFNPGVGVTGGPRVDAVAAAVDVAFWSQALTASDQFGEISQEVLRAVVLAPGNILTLLCRTLNQGFNADLVWQVEPINRTRNKLLGF